MNIGVIGANGFLGRTLCEKFLENPNVNVYGIYNRSSSEIPLGVHKISSDIKMNIKFNVLIIAIGSHSCGYIDYINHYNFIQKVINNYIYVKIIFISSVEVYGKHTDIINLNSSFNNPSVYGTSKICQEFLIRSLKNYTIIRPTYLYGNGMNIDSLLPIWTNNAKFKKEVVVYGDGMRKQDYLHVDDLCELCLSVLDSTKNDTLIAASGNSVTNIDIANTIANCLNGVEIKFFGEDLTPSSSFDISKTRRDYNWKPKKNIEEWLINEALK